MPHILIRFALAIGTALAAGGALPCESHDADAVKSVLMSQFDKPEARLTVSPVVVSSDAAVAGWMQGERGGRALLFRQAGHWQIAVCGGDVLKDAKVLREAGVKPRDADAIASELAAAEARLAPAERARLSAFDGMVRMNGAGQHHADHPH